MPATVTPSAGGWSGESTRVETNRPPGRQADGDGHGDELAERAVAQVRLGDDAEDAVAGGIAGDPGSHRVDRAREILAQNHREAVLHHALEGAFGHGQVEAVDGGGV